MAKTTTNVFDSLEPSIVQILSKGDGLGVISNDYIFTAAHCLDVDFEGGIALGDFRYQKCRSSGGQDFSADILFVDAVSDLAVLCCPDSHAAWNHAEAYDQAIDECGIELYRGPFPSFREEPIVVQIRNKAGWVNGKLSNIRNGRAWVNAATQVHGGASGGPIIDSDGKLVAINSVYSETTIHSDCNGLQPVIQRAWPVWLAKELATDD